jgi:hypothetical protein
MLLVLEKEEFKKLAILRKESLIGMKFVVYRKLAILRKEA